MDVPGRADLDAMRSNNIGRLLLRTFRAYNARAVAGLRARGHASIGLAHTSLLIHLDLEGTRVTVLAERAGMTKQAMGQVLVDLERRGYVARSTDPADRRALLVTLTEAGRRFFDDAHAVHLELETQHAAILGVEGLRALRASLSRLLDHEQEKVDGAEDPPDVRPVAELAEPS